MGQDRAQGGAIMKLEMETAFVYCVQCDESINPLRIDEHKKEGHKIEVVKKFKRDNQKSEEASS